MGPYFFSCILEYILMHYMFPLAFKCLINLFCYAFNLSNIFLRDWWVIALWREGKTKYLYTHVKPLQNSCSLVPSIITAIVSNIALVYCLVLILLGHKLETCCKQNKNFRQHDISVYPVDLYHSCFSHYITLTCAETHLGFNVFWILPAQKESKQPVCVGFLCVWVYFSFSFKRLHYLSCRIFDVLKVFSNHDW